MYIEEVPENILPGQRVRIKYDCDGGFKTCGTITTPVYKVAKKNADAHDGKHICRSCQMSLKNPAHRQDVQEKIKQTNMEKYGSTCAMNTKENTEARVAAQKDKMGEIVKKRKQTNRRKYGVDAPAQCQEVKDKMKAAFQEKYGTEHPMQNEEVLAQQRATTKERYGVECVLSLPETKIKSAQTMLKRYGVEKYNQLPEMREYLRQNCTTWLADSYDNPWAKGITRPEEWNEKQRETVCNLIERGLWKSGPKSSVRGVYTSSKCRKRVPIFRSSYELLLHWHLDHDDTVEWYDYEPFQVPYYDTEGKKRHYTVDFVIKYRGQEKMKAIEVKNNYTKDSCLTKNKYQGFMEVCGEFIDCEIWANDKIAALGLDLLKIMETDNVELWEN